MTSNEVYSVLGKLFFPQVRCICCGEPRKIDPESPLCDDCAQALCKLAILDSCCPQCRSPVKTGHPCAYCSTGKMGQIERAYAPFFYLKEARQLVIAMKFGPVELAAKPLANAMAREISGLSFDAMVPVPLHSSSLRLRGMNQSELLCRLIQAQTNIPTLKALAKSRRTRRQSSLASAQREKNVQHAFSVSQGVKGMSILLVDDVRTTGSTARACAMALRDAGAHSICLLTATVAGGTS